MKNIDITAVPELYGVVYMLTNPRGQRYIGSTVDLRHRMRGYRNGEGHGLIGESILKYGFENHQLSILAKNISDKNLRAREYKFIKKLKPELNLVTVNVGGLVRHAESTKQKMSEVKKGENNPNFGRPPSPEHRAKISKANTGKTRSPEHCAIISATHKGKKLSPEHCAIISATHKGKKISPEHRAKLSAANKGENNPNFGKKISAEQRAKQSAAMKGRPQLPEYVEKRRKARQESYHRKNNKRDKRILSLRKKDKTYREIAESVGLSKGRVRRICLHNTEILKKEAAQQFRKQKRNKKIIAMRREGATLQAIADCIGLSKAQVGQICRQANK